MFFQFIGANLLFYGGSHYLAAHLSNLRPCQCRMLQDFQTYKIDLNCSFQPLAGIQNARGYTFSSTLTIFSVRVSFLLPILLQPNLEDYFHCFLYIRVVLFYFYFIHLFNFCTTDYCVIRYCRNLFTRMKRTLKISSIVSVFVLFIWFI